MDCQTNQRSIPFGYLFQLLILTYLGPFLVFLRRYHSWRNWQSRRQGVRRYHSSWFTLFEAFLEHFQTWGHFRQLPKDSRFPTNWYPQDQTGAGLSYIPGLQTVPLLTWVVTGNFLILAPILGLHNCSQDYSIWVSTSPAGSLKFHSQLSENGYVLVIFISS